jgi:chemotaxis protein methyltransferase CheR
MIDALTTNFTSFFREHAHFDFLRATVLPALSDRSRVEIWTAACSTGEEAYSIAMTLLDEFGPRAHQCCRVVASDISSRVLDTARRGVYPASRFEGFPADWKRRHLLRGTKGNSGQFRMRDEVRSLVEFRQVNLLSGALVEGSFPVIFLRNVMIYFDRPTQARVLRAITPRLEPGGYLFVGHSESLNGVTHDFELVQAAVYRKPQRPSSARCEATPRHGGTVQPRMGGPESCWQ